MKKIIIALLFTLISVNICLAQNDNANQGSECGNCDNSSGGNSNSSVDCEDCTQGQTNNSLSTQNQGESSNLSNTQSIKLNQNEIDDLEDQIQKQTQNLEKQAYQNQEQKQTQNQLKVQIALESMHQVANSLQAKGADLTPYVQTLENNFSEALNIQTNLDSKSAFVEFFTGANQDEVSDLQSISNDIENSIADINNASSNYDTETQALIDKYLSALAAERDNIETYIQEKSNKKGIIDLLFGWMWK